MCIDTDAMVIDVGGLAEGNITRGLSIMYGHGIDVGRPGGQAVDEDERPAFQGQSSAFPDLYWSVGSSLRKTT